MVKIEDLIKKRKGFTIELTENNNLRVVKPEEIKNGYLYSITDNQIDPKRIKSKFIELCVFARMLQKTGNKVYIGYWFDSDTNTHYLDLTLFESNKEVAIKTAKVFNQKALFNTTTQQTVNVLESDKK